MSNKKNYKVLWPGEKPGNDTTLQHVYLSSVFFQAFFYFAIAYILLGFMLWRPLPILGFPVITKTPMSHIIGSTMWTISMGFPAFETFQAISWHRWLASATESSQQIGIFVRYILIDVVALLAGFWGGKQAFIATGGVKHVRGKFVLRGKDAFKDLQREFWHILKGDTGSGLVLATQKPFDPITQKAEDTLKAIDYIEKPNDIRTKHQIIVGGSGRGKTQLINFTYISQIYRSIRNGDARKLLLADTPKTDYTNFFHPKHRILIAPHLVDSAVWDMAKDINNSSSAKEFWKGVIPPSTNDPIWSNAAVAIGTGCTTILQKICPNQWNLGMLVYLLGRSAKDLQSPLQKYYPEANQIMSSAEETLSSVMFNISSYTNEFTDLARIYDGFETKKVIFCSTIKSLYQPLYFNWLQAELKRVDTSQYETKMSIVRKEETTEEKDSDKDGDKNNYGYVFVEIAKTLMKEFPLKNEIVVSGDVVLENIEDDTKELTWELFKKYILRNYKSIDEKITEHKDWVSREILEHILTNSAEWDKIETKERVSVKEWIIDPNPKKKVLILQPYETSKSLTDGLIKGILYFANRVILGELKDSDDRRMHILIDEFQSYGDVYEFMSNAFSLYRSRGIDLTIAFQDIAQMQKIYGEEVVDFMLGNVGNIVICGSNAGNTNQKLSDLLGNRTIKKLHKSVSKGKEGSSSSEDLQDHDESVMSPSEFNQLGANRGTKSIQFLYICGGLNPVYVLDVPLQKYPKRNGANITPYLTDAHKEIHYLDFSKWKNQTNNVEK